LEAAVPFCDADPPDRSWESTMDQMMDGGMWGMGIGELILLMLIVLVFVALVKFVFFR
jgi:hypothetical protein